LKQSLSTLGRHLLALFFIGVGLSLAGLLVSPSWAQGFGLGALISFLPHSYFALQAFRISAAVAPQKAYFAFWRGESGKFLLTAALFALLFTFRPDISAPAVFTGFGVMLITQIIASVFLIRHLESAE
jgi:ATP synthase protein I